MVFISDLSAPSLFWAVNSILVFIVCVLSAGVLIPQILLISFRRNLFDTPDERKIHQGVVPRLGGIAFKPVASSRWRCCSVYASFWAMATAGRDRFGRPSTVFQLLLYHGPLFGWHD